MGSVRDDLDAVGLEQLDDARTERAVGLDLDR
jgi:hypothetical protein